MKHPIPTLQKGNIVALAAPARRVTPDELAPAAATLHSWGLRVHVPEGLYATEGQLAGSDSHRAGLMQQLLDNNDIRAIFCCRGGYGTVRIIDRLDFSRFAVSPKWIVGYSDITVLHSHIHATLGLPTLHATMPINFPASGDNADTRSLHEALFAHPQPWSLPPHPLDRQGVASGTVVGGNLSILYSLLGSRSQMDTRGKILLIEDLDEYIYHIDRMMQALRRSGMLEGLAALLVGHLSELHDNTVPFGRTGEEAVLDAVAGYDFPVLFNVPVGHSVGHNQALVLGQKMHIECSDSKKICTFAP